MQHSWQHNVVDIIAPAANETVVFYATPARAHSTNLDFIETHQSLPSSSAIAHFLCSPEDRLDDVLVPRATTQVS